MDSEFGPKKSKNIKAFEIQMKMKILDEMIK